MATFFVGQRVRVVGWWRTEDFPGISIAGAENIGLEAVVNELSCGTAGRIGVGITINNVDDWVAPASGLEPIVPEGMQPVSWSECLRQPEGVAA